MRDASLPQGWDFDERLRPARSTLVPIEPLGLGTPDVEAFSSILPRQAIDLGMPPSHFAVWVLGEQLGRLDPASGSADEWGRYFSAIFDNVRGSINGTGRHARSWVEAIRTLGGSPAVAHTTCIAWADVLPTRGLMTAERPVCPRCLEEMRFGSIVYEKLIWQFTVLEVCPIHKVKLEVGCPLCARSSPTLGSWAVPGRCGRCGAWRGRESGQPADRADAEWQSFVGAQLGELVAATPSFVDPPTGAGLAEGIGVALERTGSSMSQLARMLGVSVASVSLWLSGRRTPSLAASLRLCRLGGFRLVDFLMGRLEALQTSDEAPGPVPVMPAIRVHDWAAVRRALEAGISTDPPPSVAAVTAKLGVDQRDTRRRYPVLFARLRDTHHAWRTNRLATKRQAEDAAVDAAMARLDELGIYPGRERVQRELPHGIWLRNPYLRRRWKHGLKQRGLL